MAERGGINVYSAFLNDPTDRLDPFGLAIVNLKYKAYIETSTVTFFGRTFNGGTKILHSVDVNTDIGSLTQVQKYIGHTIEYAYPGGPQIGEGQASGSTVRAFVDSHGRSRGSSEAFFRVKMEGDEGNPLVAGAPGITYEVLIYFFTCSRKIYWTGWHDRFPSHKFYVDGARVHRFSHVESGTTPIELFPFTPKEHFSGSDTY
jgi:hypothetical protein